MKTKTLFLIMLGIFFSILHGQVGINTQDPKATLDVNGDVRIRKVDTLASSQIVNKLLVLNDNNVVNQIDFSRIQVNIENAIVKGVGGTGFSLLSISLLNGWLQASFPILEIDDGNHYNLTQQEFTAPSSGVYNVHFFLEMESLLSVSTIGIGIFKIDGISGIRTLLSEESFANVNVLGIGVSPPTRSTETLVKLNAGDKIIFGMKGIALANIGLLENSKAQFFILQVR
ncbi:hypothetical protein [Chryseobacterium sp. SIMBA_028]|uniref:hypothetical protein n=1 Tax=Chryseobacterium sp. SIMBA_028 TaxID=3085771 RepID=UPI00397829C4